MLLSLTFTFTGPNNYTFTGNSAVVSPTVTSQYFLTATSVEGCLMNGSFPTNVYVNSPSITINSGTICAGNSFTLSPSGAASYTYSSGSNIVTPTITSTFFITGTDTSGCVSNAPTIAQVTVIALPTPRFIMVPFAQAIPLI